MNKLNELFGQVLIDFLNKSDNELIEYIKNDSSINKEKYKNRSDMLNLILYSKLSYMIASYNYLKKNKPKSLTFQQEMLLAQYNFDRRH